MITTLGFSIRVELAHHCQRQSPNICLSGYFSYTSWDPNTVYSLFLKVKSLSRPKKCRLCDKKDGPVNFSRHPSEKKWYENWYPWFFLSIYCFLLWNSHGFRFQLANVAQDYCLLFSQAILPHSSVCVKGVVGAALRGRPWRWDRCNCD